jgi:hypothetical protein
MPRTLSLISTTHAKRWQAHLFRAAKILPANRSLKAGDELA